MLEEPTDSFIIINSILKLNDTVMTRKAVLCVSIAATLAFSGCIKETYYMDTLSGRAHLSPVLGLAAVRGDISISDLKNIPNDTVIFDEDNFIRIVYKQDSVLDFSIDDYADFDNLGEFHLDKVYPVAGASINIKDTVTFNAGSNIEIVKIAITTGSVNYSVRSVSSVNSNFTIILPTVLRGASQVTHTITVPANSTVTGSLSLNGTVIDLSTDPKMRFNRLPVQYSVIPVSGSFSPGNLMYVKIDIPAPEFDYAKGYFGQQTEKDEESLDLEIEEFLEHISGEFHLANPSITLKYSNSFAIPTRVELKADGIKDAQTIPLDLDPFDLSYPSAPAERDKTGVFRIDKNNSSLPELVSLPPEKVNFSGSAMMNPGGNDGSRNNYIFSNSRFLGNLEVEVPLELSITNLQFTDTTENFLKIEDSSDTPVNTEDFEFMRIDLDASNGFPLGVSVNMALYNSQTGSTLYTVTADDILEPASVDAGGHATEQKSCSTKIEIDRDFWSSVNDADQIIFSFTLVTTDGGAKNIKIYSDYRIDFKAALVLKPDFKFDFK